MNGIVYIAYGKQAKAEARESIKSLCRFVSLPIMVIDESTLNPPDLTDSQKARLAKTMIPQLVDYDRILYLDADTRINGNVNPVFEILDDWDLAIAPSKNQGNELFKHIKNEDEKQETLHELGNWQPIQLQAGVVAFDRSRCAALFEEWRRQWLRWKDQDQAALLRALAIEPVRVWLLGKDWNSEKGGLIQHLFGRV